jgi:hypothetical protein
MSGRFPPLRFARNQVGAGSPIISANNRQSQKPARPGYYGQSIGHDITAPRFRKKPGFEHSECDREQFNKKTYYSNPKSFVNFLLPPLGKGRVGVG